MNGYRDFPASAPWANTNRSNRSYNFGNNAFNSTPKKRSSAKYKRAETTRNGKPCVVGYKYSKRDRGIIKYIAAPYRATERRTSATGKDWENWIIALTYPSGEVKTIPCLFDCDTHTVYVKSMNLIAKPSTPGGGYFGKHISKTYNK